MADPSYPPPPTGPPPGQYIAQSQHSYAPPPQPQYSSSSADHQSDDTSDDARLARQLQDEEDARAAPASDPGNPDRYYGQQQAGRPAHGQGTSPAYGSTGQPPEGPYAGSQAQYAPSQSQYPSTYGSYPPPPGNAMPPMDAKAPMAGAAHGQFGLQYSHTQQQQPPAQQYGAPGGYADYGGQSQGAPIPPAQGYYAPGPGAQIPPTTSQPASDGGPHYPSAMDHQAMTNFNAPMSDPTHYTRDPHRLTAYLVPFPRPEIKPGLLQSREPAAVPQRFLIYTPPAPPLAPPKEGEKEERVRKLQRKWQNEVREAKTNQAKVTSWKGVKGRATKGIDWAMGRITTSNLDFMNRIPATSSKSPSRSPSEERHADDGVYEGETTKKTIGLEEVVMVYPAGMHGTQEQLREEFVNSMLKTKSKAQRDSVIATGLLPVAFAIDIVSTVIWPFGGLVEVDAVWAASSFRGAKAARSVTKRLNSSGQDENAQLKLTFVPSDRTEVLSRYLLADCHDRDSKLFRQSAIKPTESEVLEAIGWSPSQTGGETKNWEDEQWETSEVKDDFKNTMRKGAKEWDKWCKNYEKDPEKALNKG